MARMRTKLVVLVAVVGLAVPTWAGSTVVAQAAPEHPNRVLIVLFDQMLPEYADQFDMPNFRSLRDAGTNFKRAYLGYMASETVMAHNVITSGLYPKHMGWTDEAYRDTENLFGRGTDAMHITGDLSLTDFGTLISHEGYPKLADYLHEAFPGTKFIVVGEKSYAVESAVAPTGDIGVRMSGRSSSTLDSCGLELGGRYRQPAGKNVPTYLSTPFCGRYFINSADSLHYGTRDAFPTWIYPEDGNRFFPGTDASALAGHTGGDEWVADAAIEMMQREPWSGMFVTLGAIDKAAHMWGAQADAASFTGDCNDPDLTIRGANQTHVRCAAEIADEQLGRDARGRRGPGRGRRRGDLGGAHRRPRRHVRRAVLREDRPRRHQQQQLVLRAGRCVRRRLDRTVRSPERSPVQHAVADPRAVDRDGERPVLLPVDGDRDLADRPLDGGEAGWRRRDARHAGGDRFLLAGRRPLPAVRDRTRCPGPSARGGSSTARSWSTRWPRPMART